jgi:hypothetical protein
MPGIKSKKLKLSKQAQWDLTGLQTRGSWAVAMPAAGDQVVTPREDEGEEH